MGWLYPDKLDNGEIKKKIEEYSFSNGYIPSQKLVDDILNQFWFHDYYNSFISDSVFLNYLLEFLDEKKLTNFSRYDFYSYFYDILIPVRQILQAFALGFEEVQTDNVPLAEFSKLIQEYKNDISLEMLEKSHLAKIEKRKDGKYFIWQHHTLTEFLVAEYILQTKNSLTSFCKLAVIDQEGLIAIKPSWYGVLQFLLESPKGLIFSEWLLNFLEKYTENIDDNIAEIIVYKHQDSSRELKNRIFDLIYNNYYTRLNWLPTWARTRLSHYVNGEIYIRLKKDIKEHESETATFVRRGNAISIVEGLLENKDPLLTSKEKDFWKKKLINFANDKSKNGVLQRFSLHALEYYRDSSIIPQVAKNTFEDTNDSLVRDAFLQFCFESDANAEVTIDFLIEGTIKDSIYARYGLFSITEQKAIAYFLKQAAANKNFLIKFHEDEKIFNKENGDPVLLKNITNVLNKNIILLLKQLIFSILKIDTYYPRDSSFLRSIFLIIKQEDEDFIFEFLETIKNTGDDNRTDHLFYEYNDFFALLLTKENVAKFFQAVKEFPPRSIAEAKYLPLVARRINGDTGNAVYEEAVKLNLIEPIYKQITESKWEEQQEERKKAVYLAFLNKLQPKEGKFITDVFEYFLSNREEIEKHWDISKDKKRLITLAVDEGIKKIEPRKFKLRVSDKTTEGRQFSWSTPASFYGSMLEIVREFAPEEINNSRQNIIDFIPYAFSDDASRIFEILPEINDNELNFVNNVMEGKVEGNDARYLTASSYIYLMERYAKQGYHLTSVKPVLKSFVDDSNIRNFEKSEALEALRYFINAKDEKTKTWLQKIANNEKNPELARIANGVLITNYHDEDAINWRFEQIKIPKEFDSRAFEGIAHSVGPTEEEFMSLRFARPLIELHDIKYLPKFFDLLDHSFTVIEKQKNEKYWDYVSYLWKIVIGFVEKLKDRHSFEPLMSLEKYVNENVVSENANWLKVRITELRKEYIGSISNRK